MKKFRLNSLLILIGLLITACSSKFAYNNLDWLLYWYLDDYVELDSTQKALLDTKIESLHDWHRSNELELYRDHLNNIKQDIESDQLGEARWNDHLKQGKQHWERFRDQASPDFIALSINLSDQQIEKFFNKLEKKNIEEIEERSEKIPDEQIKENQKNAQKQLRRWIGKLNDQQKQLLDRYVNLFEPTFEDWINYRRAIQAESKRILFTRNENAYFQEELSSVLSNPDQFRSDAYIKSIETNRKLFGELLSEISATLTDDQRARALDEIGSLIDDLDDLIKR